MKEIKFRYVVKSKVTGQIHKVIYYLRQIEQLPLHKLSDVFGSQYELISTDPYTGIKDRNGADIFESDIVEIEFYDGKSIYSVMYNENGFRFSFVDAGNREYGYKQTGLEKIRVIGNIHENPELIGGGTE